MKLNKCRVILPVLLLVATSSWAKNVLVLDANPSPSHRVWLHRFSRALAEHGYNVTSLSFSHVKEAPENLHSYLLDISPLEELKSDVKLIDLAQLGTLKKLLLFTMGYSVSDKITLDNPAFKAIMNYPADFKFDVIIYNNHLSLLAFADRFPEAKLIGANPHPSIEYTNPLTKAPGFPAFIPNAFMDAVEESFWSRLRSFLIYATNHMVMIYFSFPRVENDIASRYPMKRRLREIYEKTAIQLVNHHPVLDHVSPIMPGVIPVGGLQIETPKALPSDLEEVFATSREGVILFSLGSFVKSEMLDEERLKEFVAALAEFPDYHILWKIDLEGLNLKMPPNVFTRTWLPQNDILADERTKLFISHAGGLSTQEATWYGKPMLALPVMFDQFPNAEKAVKNGMALKLSIRETNRHTLKTAIRELLDDKEYTVAARLRSRNFQDQKEKPIERALWWVDYIVRNEDVTFLKSAPLARLSYVTKHSIDVIASLTIVFLGVILGIVKLIALIFRKSKRNQREKIKIN